MEQRLVKIGTNQGLAQFSYSEQARAFVLKSNSIETRRTYEGHVRAFFHFHNLKHPIDISAIDVIRWRDSLLRSGSRPATVATKLSVVRSFFDYLRADGIVEKKSSFNETGSSARTP